MRKSRKRSANVDRKKESETKRILKEEGESEQNVTLWPRYRCVCALSVSNILFTLLCKIMAYLSIHNTVKTHTQTHAYAHSAELCQSSNGFVLPMVLRLFVAVFIRNKLLFRRAFFFIIFAFFCLRFEDQKSVCFAAIILFILLSESKERRSERERERN